MLTSRRGWLFHWAKPPLLPALLGGLKPWQFNCFVLKDDFLFCQKDMHFSVLFILHFCRYLTRSSKIRSLGVFVESRICLYFDISVLISGLKALKRRNLAFYAEVAGVEIK